MRTLHFNLMKNMKTLLNIFVLIILSINGYKTSAQSFTLNRQILSSTDDAEEKFDGSFITTSSSDIEMVYDSWNSQGLQKLGFRFANITIPSNATILNAYIQFTADGASSGSLDMTIKGEDIANSSSFSNTPNNISNRTTTTSSVLWSSIPSWADNDAGLGQRTPDLSAIVTEIITSNGWTSGNPITLIITGTGGSSQLRKSYSFDGNSTKSAKLIIDYTTNSNVDLELSSFIAPGKYFLTLQNSNRTIKGSFILRN